MPGGNPVMAMRFCQQESPPPPVYLYFSCGRGSHTGASGPYITVDGGQARIGDAGWGQSAERACRSQVNALGMAGGRKPEDEEYIADGRHLEESMALVKVLRLMEVEWG